MSTPNETAMQLRQLLSEARCSSLPAEDCSERNKHNHALDDLEIWVSSWLSSSMDFSLENGTPTVSIDEGATLSVENQNLLLELHQELKNEAASLLRVTKKLKSEEGALPASMLLEIFSSENVRISIRERTGFDVFKTLGSTTLDYNNAWHQLTLVR